jgi:hypothetical protein
MIRKPFDPLNGLRVRRALALGFFDPNLLPRSGAPSLPATKSYINRSASCGIEATIARKSTASDSGDRI